MRAAVGYAPDAGGHWILVTQATNQHELSLAAVDGAGAAAMATPSPRPYLEKHLVFVMV